MGLAQKFLLPRIDRLRRNWLIIFQTAIAAGLAYFLCHDVLGHEQPFFAPMAVVIVLGITGGDRLRKAIELDLGVAIGVGMGDLLVRQFGTGTWQMPLLVALGAACGLFIDRSVLVYTQAALGAVLIGTIMPPGTSGGLERMFDAFIGGLVGVAVIALIPRSPLKNGRDEVGKVLALTGQTLADVASCMRNQDAQGVHYALQQARGSQGTINNMIAAAAEGKEFTTVSPLLWQQKQAMASLLRVLNPVDNAMRNTRVLARRAEVLLNDQDQVTDQQIMAIEELGRIADQLSKVYRHGSLEDEQKLRPALVTQLKQIGATSGVAAAGPDAVLSSLVILGQIRSLTVDLLVICGYSRRSAVACLQPTSAHPAEPPEIWES